MRITARQLRRIIKEEARRSLKEDVGPDEQMRELGAMIGERISDVIAQYSGETVELYLMHASGDPNFFVPARIEDVEGFAQRATQSAMAEVEGAVYRVFEEILTRLMEGK